MIQARGIGSSSTVSTFLGGGVSLASGRGPKGLSWKSGSAGLGGGKAGGEAASKPVPRSSEEQEWKQGPRRGLASES